jgi:YVTN family beta-propeller protein
MRRHAKDWDRPTVRLLIGILALLATGLPVAAQDVPDASGEVSVKQAPGAAGKVVVANRASGTISVIDVASDEVTKTVPLPEGQNPPEPMYVNYSWPAGRVFVGDRANDRVVVFGAGDLSVQGTVPAGRGVFHQWQFPPSTQLWVNNDIDDTATIIDAVTLEVMATVPMPEDLVERGGKPHDVIVDPNHPFAFVTMLGLAGPDDYVVQYSTETFEETGRVAVGKDPHLSLAFGDGYLYVPCQNTDDVFVFDRQTLEQVERLDVPGAHGAGMTLQGDIFYTTNLPAGGDDALFTIDTSSNELIGEPVETPYPVPHNIAVTPDASKLYVTHSGGGSDKVTVYTAGEDRRPVFAGEVTVGFNPFGLAYVP